MTSPTDQFNVTASFDKPDGYNAGDTITVTISGDDVQTSSVTETVHVVLNLLAADGATGNLSVDVPVTKQVATDESVTISSVSDSDGRTWTVSGDGLSATATA
jgi:hypothetical protein